LHPWSQEVLKRRFDLVDAGHVGRVSGANVGASFGPGDFSV
jgi:hypothetical protein